MTKKKRLRSSEPLWPSPEYSISAGGRRSWTMRDERTIQKKTGQRSAHLHRLNAWNLPRYHHLCRRNFHLHRLNNAEPAAGRYCAAAAKWRCAVYAAVQECAKRRESLALTSSFSPRCCQDALMPLPQQVHFPGLFPLHWPQWPRFGRNSYSQSGVRAGRTRWKNSCRVRRREGPNYLQSQSSKRDSGASWRLSC